MSIKSVMTSNHLILCHPLLLPPSIYPASGSFPISQFFLSGGQHIGVSASASVLPVNTQDLFPLEWTGWISLQVKGLSKIFSNTTVQKHQFFSAQLSLRPPLRNHEWQACLFNGSCLLICWLYCTSSFLLIDNISEHALTGLILKNCLSICC